MNSYNRIEKFKYFRNQQDPVALFEYIIFDDERKKEKLSVFKFHNNLDQVLEEIKFEVSEYDGENHLICQSVIHYNNFKAEANSDFVPTAKYNLRYETKEISIKLLFARFYKVTWENNVYTPIPFSFADAMKEKKRIKRNPKLSKIEKEKKSIKANNLIEEKEEAKKINNSKKKYSIKNIIKKNKTIFPTILNTIVGLLGVIFLVITMVSFKDTYNAFSVNGQDYFITNVNDSKLKDIDKGVGLYKVNDADVSDRYNQTVPEMLVLTKNVFDNSIFTSGGDFAAKLSNYKIVKEVKTAYYVIAINSETFVDSKIRSVQINAEYATIYSSAFSNCQELMTITGTCLRVQPTAFVDCPSLNTILLENATFTENSLKGLEDSLNLVRLGSVSDNVTQVCQLFGLKKNDDVSHITFEIPSSLEKSSIFSGCRYTTY